MPLTAVALYGADGPPSNTGQEGKRDEDWNGDTSQHYVDNVPSCIEKFSKTFCSRINQV